LALSVSASILLHYSWTVDQSSIPPHGANTYQSVTGSNAERFSVGAVWIVNGIVRVVAPHSDKRFVHQPAPDGFLHAVVNRFVCVD
jgi:hypothetical protein